MSKGSIMKKDIKMDSVSSLNLWKGKEGAVIIKLYLYQPIIIICTLTYHPSKNYLKPDLPSTSYHHLKHMFSSKSSFLFSARPSFPPSPTSKPYYPTKE